MISLQKFSIIISLMFVIVISIPGCKDNEDNFESTKCGDWDQIRFDEYYLNNNVWGKGTITGYSQCVFVKKQNGLYEFGWTWRWPHIGGTVKAFPEVAYGWGWGRPSTQGRGETSGANINFRGPPKATEPDRQVFKLLCEEPCF
jgi:hypothetical protein